MRTSLPAILSGARWLAGFAVVLYHLRFFLFAGYDHLLDKRLLVKAFYFATSLGHEGFVLYMLASGMLLGGLSLRRWPRQGWRAWRDVAHKALWFYAFLVPALLFGGLLDLAGSCVLQCTGVYAYFSQFTADFSIKALTENLLPVQRFIIPGLGSNSMLYLLAYECWAYLAFAVFFLLGRRHAGLATGGAIALAGAVLAPEFFGYLVLWAAGAMLFQRHAQRAIPVSRGRAFGLFLASMLASRVLGAHLAGMSPNAVLVLRTLLDLQFGAASALLLLALDTPRTGSRRSQLLWRLNRRIPSGSTIVFASHFPLMMFLVAAASHRLAIPIAGQPRPLLFALLGCLVIVIYAYAWALSNLARRLVSCATRSRRPPALAGYLRYGKWRSYTRSASAAQGRNILGFREHLDESEPFRDS